MPKRPIYDLSFPEFSEYIKNIEEKSFRASQVFDWLYKKNVKGFAEMKNLPGVFLMRLRSDFFFPRITLDKSKISKDGTTKFLFSLSDNERCETVLIPSSSRNTVCVSTQVGCKYRCRFCASGISGFKRNLSCHEIISQLLFAKRSLKQRSLTHVVFMGIGEPFDNYDNVMKAVHILNSPNGMNIAARRITVSTSGIIEGINRFKDEGLQVELAVSLHGSNNDMRGKLMPIAQKYPFDKLIKTCRNYINEKKRQVTFEYLLIKDITCKKSAAEELGKALKGMKCKLNLIRYNAVSEFGYSAPSKKEVITFQSNLKKAGVHSTLRVPRGNDIAAACGQLRNISEKPKSN